MEERFISKYFHSQFSLYLDFQLFDAAQTAFPPGFVPVLGTKVIDISIASTHPNENKIENNVMSHFTFSF